MTTVLLEVAIPKDKDMLTLSMPHLMNFVLWPITLLNLLLLIPLGTFTHHNSFHMNNHQQPGKMSQAGAETETETEAEAGAGADTGAEAQRNQHRHKKHSHSYSYTA
jgi:hypothetical protein